MENNERAEQQNETNKRSVDLEELTKMVYEKIKEEGDSLLAKPASKKKRIEKTQAIVSIILTLILIGSFGYMFYEQYKQKNQSTLFSKTNPFGFEEKLADEFANVTYYGKESMLKTLVKSMLYYDYIEKYKDPQFVKNSILNTSRNFFLYGPPGTGKTVFVKKYAYTLDRKMRIIKIKNRIGDAEWKKLGVAEKDALIGKEPCMVKVIFAEPATINSKYVGESEKNIRLLFDYVRNSKFRYILYFDECDTFFAGERDKATEHGVSAKNTFLTQLDGGSQNNRGKYISIASTNRYKEVGDEFRRRFPRAMYFGLPTPLERKYLISLQLRTSNHTLPDNLINTLVNLSHEYSQAKIVHATNEIYNNIINSKKDDVFRIATDIMKGFSSDAIETEETCSKHWILTVLNDDIFYPE